MLKKGKKASAHKPKLTLQIFKNFFAEPSPVLRVVPFSKYNLIKV
jgi:hypothetical protein